MNAEPRNRDPLIADILAAAIATDEPADRAAAALAALRDAWQEFNALQKRFPGAFKN